ncbi:hypothetical protein GMA5_21 [Gordonia phage GMA5]|uniref:Uncharacterized protein n=1 Tax=Gordonia phage GMA5 TaxID=1647472 RepID=A0A0K0MWX5_9CAUD|nr:hypothetical protein BH786_gp21 [Gordonia phage GMA5]AKI28635.1 hypothetical protein GMA5_21 [Gordonia phage GMA5]
MLTPAIEAYGLPTVILILAAIVACLVVLAVDFRRWSRTEGARRAERAVQRAEARRRHPAGRHRSTAFSDAPTVQLPAVRSHRPRAL